MKKVVFLLIILLFSWSLGCEAQFNRKAGEKNSSNRKFLIQMGGGWHFAQIQPKGYNRAILHYNEMHNSTLPEITQMSGPSGVLNFYGNVSNGKAGRILIELGYRNYSGGSNGSDQDPNISLKMHNISLGLGSTFIQSTNFDWGLGVAFNGILSYNRVEIPQNQSDISQTFTNFATGVSAFAPIYIGFGKTSVVSLSIRPYYQYMISVSDFKEMNRFINPTSFQDVPKDELNTPMHHMGLEVQLLFALKKTLFR